MMTKYTLGRFRSFLIGLISRIIHYYLVWAYPITDDQGRPIPTCPYQWPNGQGDRGKFLEGEVNSKVWGAEHGRIYRIWSGMTSEIVVRNPADIETIFKDSDKHTKAVNNDAGWLMGELLGQCLGLISGGEYQRAKAAFAPHFTHRTSALYLQRIVEFTKKHVDGLTEKTGPARQTELDPVNDLKFLPFWIIADTLYGELTAELKDELMRLLELRESLWQMIMQGGIMRYSWGRFIQRGTARDLERFKKGWARFNIAAYNACASAGQETPIVEMYSRVGDGKLDSEALLQTLDEMLFANLDVTMGGISWNLLFLAAHKDVQEQIRQEIAQARSEAGGQGSLDAYLQRSSTLLAASILESGRLKPLAAFSVPQAAPTDRRVAGFAVPAGTNFVVDTHALNIENPYWGADGSVYRPGRFLAAKRQLDMRYQFWRFGFGPRQCLGKYVVELMGRALVAHLLESHELSLAESTRWEKNPASWIMHPDTHVHCRRI
ncbi:hypothetical protein LQW54_009950 [Pestalotiopsis sp. IQ-011]